MKALVAYASSDDEQPDVEVGPPKRKGSPITNTAPPLKKRSVSSSRSSYYHIRPTPHHKSDSFTIRRLPSLTYSLIPPDPQSDPSKHQGRIRTHPHVDGQFASYVYVAVPLEQSSRGGLGRLVRHAVKHAQSLVPNVKHVVECAQHGEAEDGQGELHVSLSRPVYLRHHQREYFKNAIKSIASSHSSFSASFASFATFNNDEKTRAFLALEVGAGHSQLRELAEALTPILRSLYQKEYYAEPRFHASIAWALLKDPSAPETQPTAAPETQSDADASLEATPPQRLSTEFPTVTELPPVLLTDLSDSLGERLRQRGMFDVAEISVRIGKEIKSYPLSPSKY